jgi:hypothetical protein
MDPAQLKSAGFTDAQIAEYSQLQDAGFSGAEIEKYYLEKEPTAMQKVLRAASPYARPALEMGGSIAGSVLAAPAAAASVNPAPVMLGGGLGFAAGKLGADYLDELAGTKQAPDFTNRLAQTGKDVVAGTLGEGAGLSAMSALRMGANKLASTTAPWLYKHAIQVPGKKYDKMFEGDVVSPRDEMARVGIRDKVVPNEYGLKQANAMVDKLRDLTTEEVAKVTQKGVNLTHTTDITGPGLRKVKGEAFASGEGKTATEAVDAIEGEVKRQAGVTSQLTPNELQALKQQFYREINWEKSNKIFTVKGQFTQEAKKGIAEAAMNRLSKMSDEIAALNKDSAAYINLKEAVESTINKDFSTNMVGISSKILAVKNIGLAVVDSLMGGSRTRAHLAFALAKGAEYKAKMAGRATAYGTAKGLGAMQDRSGVVMQYDAEGNRLQ